MVGGAGGPGKKGALAKKGLGRTSMNRSDWDSYQGSGDYGNAPSYEGELSGGMFGNIGAHIGRYASPEGNESYNRRGWIQDQLEGGDPRMLMEMASRYGNDKNWHKDPAMIDQLWGGINEWQGNEMVGQPGADAAAMEGAMGKVGGAVGAAKGAMAPHVMPEGPAVAHGAGAVKKVAPGMKPGMPQRYSMGGSIGKKMGGVAQNIGQMAKASRTSSYGG